MKRLLILIVFGLLAAGVIPARAVDPASGVFDMARYVPSNVDAFLAIRTDAAYVADFNGFLSTLTGAMSDLGLPLGATTMEAALAMSFGVSEADVADMLAWSGEMIAVGLRTPPGGGEQVMIAVPLVDGEAARAYVEGRLNGPTNTRTAMGRFTAYNAGSGAYVLLADDLLMLVSNVGPADLGLLAGEAFPPLSGLAEYVEAVGALPSAEYSMGLYARDLLFEDQPVLTAALKGISLAMGGTAINGTTYAFDISAVSPTPVMRPLSVNPDFARFIPSNMGFVVHGADLASLLNTGISVAEQTGNPQARVLVSSIFGMGGMDINDFLSWTKGDFALFARVNVRSILPSLLGSPPNVRGLPGAADIGLVIEAVNAEKARAFSEALARLLRVSAPGVDGMSVSSETIRGTPVTVLIVDSPVDGGATIPFEFAFGASDEVFALGTANAVRAIFNGAEGLPSAPSYAASAQEWLPNPTTLWTLDGSTAANMAALAYLSLVPVSAGPTGALNAPSADTVGAIMDRVSQFVSRATFTGTVNADGVILLRASVTLEE